MIIPAWVAYLKVAWALKTPFVFMLDSVYKILPIEKLLEYSESVRDRKYKPYHDCNAFAWLLKANAYLDYENGIGFVSGIMWVKWRGFPFAFHAWNCAVTDQGIYQLEPQNGRIFKWDRKYIPLLVII